MKNLFQKDFEFEPLKRSIFEMPLDLAYNLIKDGKKRTKDFDDGDTAMNCLIGSEKLRKAIELDEGAAIPSGVNLGSDGN